MKNTLLDLYKKDGTKKLLASLLSILIGLAVGAIVVAIVGLTKRNIGVKGVWDGVRLILLSGVSMWVLVFYCSVCFILSWQSRR